MNKIHKIRLIGALAVAGLGLGAVYATGPGNGMTLIAASSADEGLAAINAEELWGANCAGCHGRDGKGNTRIGRRVGAQDYTDAEHQESFSDQRAFKSLKEGLVENDRERMKPFGVGRSDDNGLTDEEIVALIDYTRTFGPEDWEWTGEKNKAALDAEGEEDKAALLEYLQEHGPKVWRK